MRKSVRAILLAVLAVLSTIVLGVAGMCTSAFSLAVAIFVDPQNGQVVGAGNGSELFMVS